MQVVTATTDVPARHENRRLFLIVAMIVLLAGSCVHRATADITTDETSLMVGACCFFVSMECLEIAQAACNATGGVFLGVGTSCRDGGCDVGACCVDVPAVFGKGQSPTSGAPFGCLVIHRALCEAASGTFLGAGVECGDSSCAIIPCCLPDGSCIDEYPDLCIKMGGQPVIILGGDCKDFSCDKVDPVGACCLCDGPDPHCVMLSETDCIDAGGVFLGEDVECPKDPEVYSEFAIPFANIPDDDPAGFASTITVPVDFPVAEVRVGLTIGHSFVGDLCVTLEHDGTSVALMQRAGSGVSGCHQGAPFGCGATFFSFVVFDDFGLGGAINDLCENNLSSPPSYTPVDPLAAFAGMPSIGNWTLTVSDNAPGHTGIFLDWSLQLIELQADPCQGVIICDDPQDPCTLPGRPDPNDPDSGERVLRGFIVGYAVDWAGNEIRWNHLSAGATTVDYANGSAMEYPAASFTASAPANGAVLPNSGTLSLDGMKYAAVPQMLLWNFAAEGSTAFSSASASNTAFTELTLMPLDISFSDGAAPAHTKAEFQIWNENEVKFSGTHRCVTCWDSTLLGLYGSPNHLLINTLQTDRGKARIQGVASPLCPGSAAHALIGVQTRSLHDGLGAQSHTGSILSSMGLATATITAPITGPPPEAPHSAPAGIASRGSVAALGASSEAGRRPQTDAPVQPMGGVLTPRMGTDKGSLFVIPRVEIRWDAQGNVIRDTFVHLTNDFPSDVRVQMWFVNGDPDEIDIYGCPHKGWNFVDVMINLTQDQPLWWSALSGQPVGVSPFTVLDP